MAYTDSSLLKLQLAADRVWGDSQLRSRYMAEVDALRALLANQGNVRIEQNLNDPSKDRTVTLFWPNACELEVASCTNVCTFDGPELTTAKQDVTLTQCSEVSFKIPRIALRTNELGPEDLRVQAFLKADKLLMEAAAQFVVAQLEAAAGTLSYTGPAGWNWVQAADITTIPADQWSAILLSRLRLIARRMKMGDPYILTGDIAFAEAAYIAETNQANLDGKGDAVRFRAMGDLWYDPVNIPEVVDAERTYLIDTGAAVFAHKTRHPRQMEEIGGQVNVEIQSMPSRIIPSIYYDVEHTIKCDSTAQSNTGDYFDVYKFILRYDVLENPVPCEDENASGIYAFERQAEV